MTDLQEFISSGMLEQYVIGNTSPAETELVERMAAAHVQVREEIEAIDNVIKQYGMANAIEPNPTILLFLIATINYTERLRKGEPVSHPPMLHTGSKVEDYAPWLSREDLGLTAPLEDAFAHIIGYTPQVSTAIVWLRHGAPPETHTSELEKFLILEGTCNITIDKEVHSLKAGDVLIIPLHATHFVQVTSACPCKLILQRAAA